MAIIELSDGSGFNTELRLNLQIYFWCTANEFRVWVRRPIKIIVIINLNRIEKNKVGILFYGNVRHAHNKQKIPFILFCFLFMFWAWKVYLPLEAMGSFIIRHTLLSVPHLELSNTNDQPTSSKLLICPMISPNIGSNTFQA